MAFKLSYYAKSIFAVMLLGTVAACSHTHEESSTQRVRPLRIPNPASLYCVKKGGTLEIRHDSQKGQIGFCRLPDGVVVEEWTLFRQDNPKPNN